MYLTCLHHFSGGVWASRGCAGDEDEKRGDCREGQVRDGREGGWWGGGMVGEVRDGREGGRWER